MTSFRRSTLLVASLALVSGSVARAQGNLSTQGLGFPPGQLSTKALSMGGSIGDGDAVSPLNPAALSLLITPLLTMQAEPEFRETKLGSKTEKTSVARFPLFFAAMPIGSRFAASVSASTLFDRTWSTSARDTQVIGSDTVGSVIGQLSDGSLTDLRVAVSYVVLPWLRVGVGAHEYSGQTSIRETHEYDDTVRFAADTQRTTIGYGGNAISIGVQTLWPRRGAIGLSYRRGGTLSTYNGSAIVQSASAPDHFGLSAVYLGIQGTTLAVRVASDKWSRVAGLSPSLQVHEGLDLGVGGEVEGPPWGSGHMSLRAGARWRTLPFSTGPSAVKEQALSGGLGLPFARGRSEVNIGIVRATRTGSFGASENAWTLSTGYTVRP